MIEPAIIQELQLTLSFKQKDDEIDVRGQLSNGDELYFKEIVTFIEA